MSRYRIDERDFGCFAPSFKPGLIRQYLGESGNVLPWGTIWSGPLETAAQSVRHHMAAEADKWLEKEDADVS